jgi:dynein heavy chain
MQLFAPMPLIHFRAREAIKTAARGLYCCPMYLYPLRTGTRERPSFMSYVELESARATRSSADWCIR